MFPSDFQNKLANWQARYESGDSDEACGVIDEVDANTERESEECSSEYPYNDSLNGHIRLCE